MAGAQDDRKPWAVLAYTIAEDHNSASRLDTSAQRELKAICDAADFRVVSVAAQVDFKRRRGVYRSALVRPAPLGRGFKDIDPARHELWQKILAGVDDGEARVRLQRDATDLDAADADVLQEFLRFARSECPADRYVVSFFGHASGPLGVFSDAPSGQPQDILRLPGMVNAFRGSGHRAAVVVFRDCFMNCLEAAYQLRGAAEYVVATQALAPATGTWPWQAFMETLTPGASPYEAALGVARALGAYLDDPANRSGFGTVPYSVLDLGAADEVATRLAALADALDAARRDPARARPVAKALEASRVGSPESAKEPGDPALLDVPTMCARLAALRGDPVAAPAVALGRAVAAKLVRWHHSQTRDHQGTSLFYKPVRPDDLKRSYLQATDEQVAADDAAHYRALALSRATGWHRIALDPLPLDD